MANRKGVGNRTGSSWLGWLTHRAWLILPTLCLLIGWSWLRGSTRPTVNPLPAYPRANLAACYEVDPSWPDRPRGVTWGAVTGVAVDGQDQVWLCSDGQPPVQKYRVDGRYLGGWGTDVLHHPHQLRLGPEGNVWVVDAGRHAVYKFTREGSLLLTLGTPDESGSDNSHFNSPTDIAITPHGDIYVSDGYRNSRIMHFDLTGGYVNSWGKLGSGANELSLPHSIVVDSAGRLYVAERANGRVQVFDQQGHALDQWKGLVVPWGLSVTSQNEIWVCGSAPAAWSDGDVVLGTPPRDQLLIKFDADGRALHQWFVPKGRDGSNKPGQLNWVHCIAEDSEGALYCGDCRANRIQKLVRIDTSDE